MLLGDFKVEGSMGQQLIERITGHKDLRRESLQSLTTFLSVLINVRVPRDYRRKKPLLVKWLNEHYHEILPHIHDVTVTERPEVDTADQQDHLERFDQCTDFVPDLWDLPVDIFNDYDFW